MLLHVGCQAANYLTNDDCDPDHDGDLSIECGGGDCEPLNNAARSGPGRIEICDDGVDNDCNGRADDKDTAKCKCGADGAPDGTSAPCSFDSANQPIIWPAGEPKGSCKYGTKKCSLGSWGQCEGAVPPANDFLATPRNGSWDNNCNSQQEKQCCNGAGCYPCVERIWPIDISSGEYRPNCRDACMRVEQQCAGFVVSIQSNRDSNMIQQECGIEVAGSLCKCNAQFCVEEYYPSMVAKFRIGCR